MRILLLPLLVVLGTGCGTIIHGGNQEVSFASTPSRAGVMVDGLDIGETPIVTTLSRKNTHTVELSLDGYETKSMIINRSVSGWVFGNIVFGGIIGLGVDAATGGLYKLSPSEVNANLSATTAQGTNGDMLMIAVVLEPATGWERIGQLILSE